VRTINLEINQKSQYKPTVQSPESGIVRNCLYVYGVIRWVIGVDSSLCCLCWLLNGSVYQLYTRSRWVAKY